MPTKVWAVGEEVLAPDFNTFVQKQIVAVFPNAAARDAALPAPTVGMLIYVVDVAEVQLATTAVPSGWRRIFGPASYGAVIYRQMIYTSQTSGDIGTTAVVHTSTGAPGSGAPIFTAGHDYDIRAYLNIQSTTGTGATAAQPGITVAGVAQMGSEIYVASPNLNTRGDLQVIYRALTTGPTQVDATLVRAWWGGNPVKFSSGPGLPRGIVITDLGAGV